jgi:hypothetical protein
LRREDAWKDIADEAADLTMYLQEFEAMAEAEFAKLQEMLIGL